MTGISPDVQRLVYAGKQMGDDRILAEYNIDEGDVLHLFAPVLICELGSFCKISTSFGPR